jgi:hypothetical protein
MNRPPTGRREAVFALRTVGEILGVVVLCAVIVTCAWGVMLYRS